MKLFLDDFFQRQWLGKDPFAEVENLDGEVFRNIKNRRTLKFSLDGITPTRSPDTPCKNCVVNCKMSITSGLLLWTTRGILNPLESV